MRRLWGNHYYRLRIFIIFVFALGAVGVLMTPTVLADSRVTIGNVLPHPAASQMGGHTDVVNDFLIQSDHGVVNKVELGLYFPTRDDHTIDIARSNTGGDNVCDMPGNTTIRVSFDGRRNSAGASLGGGGTQSTSKPTCHDLYDDSYTVNKGTISPTKDPSTGYYYVEMILQLSTSSSNADASFAVQVGPNSFVGIIRSGTDVRNNASLGQQQYGDGWITTYFTFGLACTASATHAPVTVYDADNGVAAQRTHPVTFYVAHVSASGGITPLTKSEYGQPLLSDTGGGTESGGNTPIFTPGNFDNKGGKSTVYIANINPGDKYVLVTQDQHTNGAGAGSNNFIEIGTPGDQIFGASNFVCPNEGLPTGSISIACTNSATGQQTISYRFSDPNSTGANPVKGEIGTGASASGSIMAATTTTPGTKNVIDKGGGKTYKLWVLDVKDGGGNDGYKLVASATSRPCNPALGVGSCSISTSPSGWLEISSLPFDATYYGSVSGLPASTSRTTGGSWSSSGAASRTYTRTDTYYVVVQNQFESDYTSTPASQTANAPDGSSTSHTFTGFGPESDPYTYTVSGTYSYTIQKVVDTYQRTDTRDDKGNVSYGSFNLVGHNPTNVSNGSADCGHQDVIYAARPYLSAYSGDVIAGAYENDPGGGRYYNAHGCTTTGSASVVSWNHNGGTIYNGSSHNDYAGGGSESAVYALTHISSFTSALNNSPTNPKRTSFANTVNIGSGQYGGGFNSALLPSSCDFMSDVNTDTPSLPNPSSYSNGSVTDKQTYVVHGSVYISGNVVYANSGSWALSTAIPRFKLVVIGGNIYVGAGVSELDGMYVAVPSGGSGGTIYTCAYGLGSPVPTSSLYNDCGTQLTVYGGFAAKQIQFLRTGGSLRDAQPSDSYSSNNAGETFVFSPEMWLPDGSESRNYHYDAILGLPPVL